MPSKTHQNFVQLYLRHPELVFELARRAGTPVTAEHDRIELTLTEFDDPLKPGNAVRTDLAVVGYIGDQAHRALALEVQLGADRQKEWSSVMYRAGLRYHHECSAWTVFFSPDPEVREFNPNSAASRPARFAGGPSGRSELDLRFAPVPAHADVRERTRATAEGGDAGDDRANSGSRRGERQLSLGGALGGHARGQPRRRHARPCGDPGAAAGRSEGSLQVHGAGHRQRQREDHATSTHATASQIKKS